MKRIFIFPVVACLFGFGNARGVELACMTSSYFETPGRGTTTRVQLVDTDSDLVAPGDMSPTALSNSMSSTAMAPDGRLYYTECGEERWLDETTGVTLCIPTIRRVTVTFMPDGSVLHDPAAEVVYRTATPFTVTQWYEEVLINDLAIRVLDDGGYRVYFSTGGCGACEADFTIYYLDETGNPQLYYTVPKAEVGVASCEGLSGTWSGNFAFGDNGNLYLSSGNHCPAAIFEVPGAGPDGVTGSPRQVDERSGGIMDFIWVGPEQVYLVDRIWDSNVLERNPATGAESRIFRPARGDASCVNVDDISPVVRPPSGGAGPPRAALSNRLPRRRAEAPSQFVEPVLGSLRDRLPIPPRPERASEPDLKMVGIQAGRPKLQDEGRLAIVPIRVFVRNVGSAVVEPFKIGVAARYAGLSRPVDAAFIVPGLNKSRFPFWKGLASGEVMAFTGQVHLRHPQGKGLQGQSVAISAQVDSCQGEFFGFLKGESCRIRERDEHNNQMSIQVGLSGPG